MGNLMSRAQRTARGNARAWTFVGLPYSLALAALAARTLMAANRAARARDVSETTPPTAAGAPVTSNSTGVAWVVLPTFNEAENIESIVAAVVNVLDTAAPGGFRVLIVDDDSPDGTGQIADRLAAENPSIEVLHRTNREGLGPAYVAGFRRALAAGASYVLEMDADGSHDPRDLARLLAAVRDGGADLALGSRYVAGGRITDWGIVRRATSRGGCWYARIVLGLRVRDLTGGFKCFSAQVLHAVDLGSVLARGYAFQVELTHRALRGGFQVQEIPITFRDRERGHSKMSPRIALEAAWLVPQLRWARRRPTPPSSSAAAVSGFLGDEPGRVHAPSATTAM
jgi:dolichol-phosphate mannosyltransferase